MHIPRIYYPHPIQCKDIITLDKTTAHHLTHVLRLRHQESLILFNGEGGEYLAEFYATKKSSQALILSFKDINRESSLSFHLGQGLARGDRMDIVIQKATELGVSFITPLLTSYTQVKLNEERSQKRMQHWQNIAISAAEQCGRTQIPNINTPLPLSEWIKEDFKGISLVFEPNSEVKLKNITPTQAIRLAIGPESGWSNAEMASLKAHHFIPCNLGPRILRTETASIVAMSILQELFGDVNLSNNPMTSLDNP